MYVESSANMYQDIHIVTHTRLSPYMNNIQHNLHHTQTYLFNSHPPCTAGQQSSLDHIDYTNTTLRFCMPRVHLVQKKHLRRLLHVFITGTV